MSFEPILSPSRAHGLGARADEGDADPLAELGERGVLGDEPPADPGGVRSGVEQRLLQDREVEVGTGRGGSEVVGEVGLAHEHRSPLALGVERDDLWMVEPVSALRSRTAWMRRIAASPRLTTAIRLNVTDASLHLRNRPPRESSTPATYYRVNPAHEARLRGNARAPGAGADQRQTRLRCVNRGRVCGRRGPGPGRRARSRRRTAWRRGTCRAGEWAACTARCRRRAG